MNTKEILQGIKAWTVGKLDAKVEKTTTVNGHALSDDVTVTKSDVGLGNVTNDAQVKRAEMGVSSGVATLGTDGKVPSSQLPSYVDDVLEYTNRASFPEEGESGKIYVSLANNTTYRWSGTTYVQIKGDLTIGTTTGTAADGKVVNDHVNDDAIHVTSNDKNTWNAKQEALTFNTTPSSSNKVATMADIPSSLPANGGDSSTVNNHTVNSDVPSNAVFTDTTYSNATISSDGLMSSSDKSKLNGIESGAQKHIAPTAKEVKSALGTGSGTTKYLREDGTWQTPEGGSAAAYTPTLASAPTSSTTTYTKDGQTVSFEIGQFCRVANQEADTGYTFYQLHDLNNGVAKWAEQGIALERMYISVSSNHPSLTTSLRRLARITVKQTSDDTTVYDGTITDDNKLIKLTPAEEYTVEASSVEGYATPEPVTFTASYEGQRNVVMQYDTTKVYLSMAGENGGVEGEAPTGAAGTVKYSGGADQTLTNNTDFALVPTGTAFTIDYASVNGYATPASYSATASGTSMTATKATYIYGVLELTVAMSDSSSADLARVAPQISINGGSASAMTGSGGVFTANLEVGDTYAVTFNSLVAYGYQSPASISGTFNGGVQQESATYQTDIYTLSSIQTTKDDSVQGANPSGAGCTLTYTGISQAAVLSTVNDTAKIPSDLTPTVTANDVYGYAKNATVSSTNISLTYATDAYTLSVSANQGNTDIASTVVRVSAAGISSTGYIDYTGGQTSTEVLIPSGTTVTSSNVSSTGAPTDYRETISVASKAISVIYEAEVLTASFELAEGDDSQTDLSGQEVTIYNGSASLGTLSDGESMKIPYGINYTIKVTSNVPNGYIKPANITKNWADISTKNVDIVFKVQNEYVDLGLPSGIKWCTHNIGGEKPEDYGYYFSWGNVEGHTKGSGYKFSSSDYNSSPGHNLTGNIAVGATYDIARKVMGAPWRLPTYTECKELCDNTDKQYTTLNGVKGWKFMKKSDHSVFIFFPACGYYSNSTNLSQEGTRGHYWTSNLWTTSYQGTCAYNLRLDASTGYDPGNYPARYTGTTGRAVQ